MKLKLDENGHVVTYTVGEAEAEGYAVTYSEESVTLDDGTDKTITVTNTRQVGKTTFTKAGSDNATLPDAVYAVLTPAADLGSLTEVCIIKSFEIVS